jgi:hypothetical protein
LGAATTTQNHLCAFKEKLKMAKEQNVFNNRISRRTLMATSGVALAGGFAVSESAQAAPQAKQAAAPMGGPGEGRSWMCDDGFKSAVIDGVKGFQINVRFTGYRAMPINTISEVSLKIDGEQIDPAGMILTAYNTRYKVQDLPKLGGKDWRAIPWLYILDKAELFCPYAKTLSPGTHVLEGYMATRGTYGTGGRGEGGRMPRPTLTKRLVLESD